MPMNFEHYTAEDRATLGSDLSAAVERKRQRYQRGTFNNVPRSQSKKIAAGDRPAAKEEDKMKTTQSVLPGATRIECREQQRDLFTASNIRARLSEVFTNGFWYCDTCEARCEREEGEHGQPAHCDMCGGHRLVWNPPLWTQLIPDGKVLEPHHLKPQEAA